jgi:tRNA 2-thiocytidine biosynthesis protein TtcA
MKELERIISYGLPSWLKRFVKQAGKGINRFNMIQENDAVLLGVSGGKDSLALSVALSLRRKWLPIRYALHAGIIEWHEYPIPSHIKEQLIEFFQILDISYTFLQASMIPESFKHRFNCYLCSRNRKRILFNEADRKGIEKIAFGHHLDDLAETSLINICLRGKLDTMHPNQEFFNGKLSVIRPLCEVRESTIEKVVSRLELPVFSPPCPFKESNIRTKIKPIIREFSHLNKYVREHIYASFWDT